MAKFAATMTFEIVYQAKQTELTTRDRAHALAETMVAVLRGSPKIKAIDIQCDSIGEVEPLDDSDGLTHLRINP